MNSEQFNAHYPVGTPCVYFPIRGQPGGKYTKTRSEAWKLGSGHPVVAVDGQAGGVSLTHLMMCPTRRKAEF